MKKDLNSRHKIKSQGDYDKRLKSKNAHEPPINKYKNSMSIENNINNHVKLIWNHSDIVTGDYFYTLQMIKFVYLDKVLEIKCSSIDFVTCLGDYYLRIVTKDFSRYVFIFDKNELDTRYNEILSSINVLDDNNKSYAFTYKILNYGTSIYHVDKLYDINFINFIDPVKKLEHLYQISNINKYYNITNTYCEQVIIPKNINDDTIEKMYQFYQDNRFPIISYIDNTYDSILLKSSKLIWNKESNKKDEKYNILELFDTNEYLIIEFYDYGMEKYYEINPSTNNILLNRRCMNYKIFCYFDIKINLCKFLQSIDLLILDNDIINNEIMYKWYDTIKSFIDSSIFISKTLAERNITAFVLDNSGIFYDTILTSLIHIINRPWCRTIKGFISLIEIEWIKYGYPFFTKSRYNLTKITNDPNDTPTFLLFLTCIYELIELNKTSFEFIPEFLEYIYENTYSSNFGTFLFDTPKERNEKEEKNNTISLWYHLSNKSNIEHFINSLYDSNSIIKQKYYSQEYIFWNDMFAKSKKDSLQNNSKSCWNLLSSLK